MIWGIRHLPFELRTSSSYEKFAVNVNLLLLCGCHICGIFSSDGRVIGVLYFWHITQLSLIFEGIIDEFTNFGNVDCSCGFKSVFKVSYSVYFKLVFYYLLAKWIEASFRVHTKVYFREMLGKDAKFIWSIGNWYTVSVSKSRGNSTGFWGVLTLLSSFW